MVQIRFLFFQCLSGTGLSPSQKPEPEKSGPSPKKKPEIRVQKIILPLLDITFVGLPQKPEIRARIVGPESSEKKARARKVGPEPEPEPESHEKKPEPEKKARARKQKPGTR